MAELYRPLRRLISLAEADYGLLDKTIEHFLTIIDSVAAELVKLSPSDRKNVKDMIEARNPLFLTTAAALAQMMHPIHRGQTPPANLRLTAQTS